MKGASSGQSNLVSSFSNISGINSLDKLGSQVGNSARKDLPNKLKINVDGVYGKGKPKKVQTYRDEKPIVSKEIAITDEAFASQNRRSPPYMADIAIRVSNNQDSKNNKRLRIVAEEQRYQNKTSQLPSPSAVSPLGGLSQKDQSRKIQVRKLLKFRSNGGGFLPSSASDLEAIKQGAILEQTRVQVRTPENKRKTNNGSAVMGIGFLNQVSGQKDKKPQVMTSGFALQNKLGVRQQRGNRNGSVGTFQSLLYRLSQPQHENLLQQTDSFFREDVFCSPKYRQEEKEKQSMKIRYDGQKVMSRSICGTRNTFTQYLRDKQSQKAKAEKQRKFQNNINRRNTILDVVGGSNRSSQNVQGGVSSSHRSRKTMPANQIISNASSTSVFAGFLKSNESRQSCLTTSRYRNTEDIEDILSRNDSQLLIKEQGKEDSENSIDSDISKNALELGGELGTGMTGKQMRAADRLSLYQKGWERMNRIRQRQSKNDVERPQNSLLQKSKFFITRQEHQIEDFYDMAQRSVSNCPEGTKRDKLIEEIFKTESVKFDNEKSKKQWIGTLRDFDHMYVPTTKNQQNQLHCRVAVSSRGNPGYTTCSSMGYDRPSGIFNPDSLGSQMDVNKISVREGARNANKLAKTQIDFQALVNFTNSNAGDMVNMGEGSSLEGSQVTMSKFYDSARTGPFNPSEQKSKSPRRKTTRIFDGAQISATNALKQKTTFKSKSQGGKRRHVYLPEVAVALRQHEKTKDLIQRQKAQDEAMDAAIDEGYEKQL